jgi:hypothetical protein
MRLINRGFLDMRQIDDRMLPRVATNPPEMRRNSFRHMTPGRNAMDFVEETTDLGAPEYAVTGVASIERISVGQIRIAKYSRRKDGNFIMFYEVWDYDIWRRAVATYEAAMQIIVRMGVNDGICRAEKH